MKSILFAFLIALPFFCFGQAKVKYVNMPSTELDYPKLSFDDKINTYTVLVHLHDFFDDLALDEDKVIAGIEALKNYTQTDDNADIYIHLDYYYKKRMETGGEVFAIPVKCTLIDGAGEVFHSEFIYGEAKVAQANITKTHDMIVDELNTHLLSTVEVCNKYIAGLLDGKQFTIGSLSNLFTIKKAAESDQKEFDDAISLVKEKIGGKITSKALLKECQPAIDFWEAGLEKYNKEDAKYLACGVNLFNMALKQNNPERAKHYFNLTKDIKSPWAPKQNILNAELADAKHSTFMDISSFAEGGKSAEAGNSEVLEKNGKIKMNNGDVLEGSISFKKTKDGVIDKVVVTKTLSDYKEINIDLIEGGVYNEVRFIRVDTNFGDELYRIVDSNEAWQIIKPIEDSGDSLLAIGNSKAKKSYHFIGVLKINAKFAELFKSCPQVVERASNKEYGRKLEHFKLLINDLAGCD